MKKIGEILLIVISVLQVPGVIQVASNTFYTTHSSTIWISSVLLSIALSLIQLNLSTSPKLNKLLRKVRFYLFKTQTISGVLMLQLLIVLCYLFYSDRPIDSRNTLITLAINLLSLNLLVFVGKLTNTDSKELILHDTVSGRMYLYTGNRIRHIPDPPTFDLLGFSWAEAIDITQKELASYEMLPPITSLKDMTLYEYRGRVYGLVNEKLKHVPDPSTLAYILNHRDPNNKTINKLTELDIAGYKFDKPFEHTV